MKKIILVFLALISAGCAVKPPQQTGTVSSPLTYEETIERIHLQARICWARNFSFFQDEYVVEKRSNVISVRRSAPDISWQSPFMIATVLPSDPVEVTLLEGDCAYGCYMDFSPDVQRWLEGDNFCGSYK